MNKEEFLLLWSLDLVLLLSNRPFITVPFITVLCFPLQKGTVCHRYFLTLPDCFHGKGFIIIFISSSRLTILKVRSFFLGCFLNTLCFFSIRCASLSSKGSSVIHSHWIHFWKGIIFVRKSHQSVNAYGRVLHPCTTVGCTSGRLKRRVKEHLWTHLYTVKEQLDIIRTLSLLYDLWYVRKTQLT